ncbi:MAG: YicC/YloC family endoribonuclease [Phycisphaerales bacterium]|nr:YicC/YloC family endoribonuclease [Phycisphaerales bacterium]
MLISMTGFGRADCTIDNNQYSIEIKCLNSKQFDLRLNIPSSLNIYELEIRNLLSLHLKRGSVVCTITVHRSSNDQHLKIDAEKIKNYYKQLYPIAKELELSLDHILSTILKFPDVVHQHSENISIKEFEELVPHIQVTINEVNRHREKEGAHLQNSILDNIVRIENMQPIITQLTGARKQKIKQDFLKKMEEFELKIDHNRLEQEIIYYLEKLDINEEQVRIVAHCHFFNELVQNPENNGRKITFLIQEIGRELNTIGAKANDAGIQKCIVEMKDELEKAKEQCMNIL